MEAVLQIFLLAAGFVMLIKGADFFVDGSSGIASRFGISQLVVGLTIVAMGTSAPEAAVSISAALKGNAGITIGNVLGSNILNIFIILGLTALLTKKTVPVASSTIKYEMPFMIVIMLILLWMGYAGNEIARLEGAGLWIVFLLYLFYLFQMAKKGAGKNLEDNEGETSPREGEKKEKSMAMLVLFTAVGLALIVIGSSVTVDAATEIAKIIGLSERFIGLTIVALGTSLPELFTSVSAARKGNADIAIGNIVGSNVFNILFVVGTSALITPVVFESKFIVDSIVAVSAGVLLWIFSFNGRSLNRAEGGLLLLGYLGYFIYLL
ncbi:MAG: calcium/sodium antiporter [Lachnospiraceae bacterium]|nr:calcium/sodium antiporter [Lachnospiraceae bacterium]